MARALAVLALFVALATAVEVKVTLNVFSGTEDPSVTFTGDAAAHLQAALSSVPVGAVQRPIPYYRMGYRGFEVVITSNEGTIVKEVYNNPKFETLLLQSVSSMNALQQTVVEHIREELNRLDALNRNPVALAAAMAERNTFLGSRADPNCTLPVRGPDDMTVYEPSSDCCGYFQVHQTKNNCYNYGNDVVTNTFAQPGRGTGQKWTYNTCEDIRASAERDGLVWAGQQLPTEQPAEGGHYVSLHIWPGTNFHWIRFDTVPAGYWSHKAGQTPVRNVDNSGQKITDPSKADFAPWSQFCGYMKAVPSKSQIN